MHIQSTYTVTDSVFIFLNLRLNCVSLLKWGEAGTVQQPAYSATVVCDNGYADAGPKARVSSLLQIHVNHKIVSGIYNSYYIIIQIVRYLHIWL